MSNDDRDLLIEALKENTGKMSAMEELIRNLCNIVATLTTNIIGSKTLIAAIKTIVVSFCCAVVLVAIWVTKQAPDYSSYIVFGIWAFGIGVDIVAVLRELFGRGQIPKNNCNIAEGGA